MFFLRARFLNEIAEFEKMSLNRKTLLGKMKVFQSAVLSAGRPLSKISVTRPPELFATLCTLHLHVKYRSNPST